MQHTTTHEVCIDSEAYEQLLTVFPGGKVLASPERVIDSEIDNMIRAAQWMFYLRMEAAMSGAMRWPWSQEAQIVQDYPRYY